MKKLMISVGMLLAASSLAMADDPKPPPVAHKGPPQEALDACAKAKADDACSFTHDAKAVKGTCQTRKHGTGLVCRKPHAAPPAKAT